MVTPGYPPIRRRIEWGITVPDMGNETPRGPSQEDFKNAFSKHPAGIALITANTPEGPVGLTASSVSSVAVDPLALSFSVTRATGSAGGILNAPSYLIHLLDHRDAHLAKLFARSGTERFTAEQGWETLPTGEPYLPSARVALRGQTLQTIPVGSSTLVLAEILDVLVGEPGEPLVYYDRGFHTL